MPILVLAAAVGAAGLEPPLPFLFAQGFAPGEERPFVADLDGDGFAELIAVSGRPEGEIWIARNERGARVTIERGRDGVAIASEPVAVSDFDGNGRADIAALARDGSIRVAFSDGGGGRIAPQAGSAPATGEVRLLAADADGDRISDLFILCGPEVYLLRADGRGGFEPGRRIGEAPLFAIAADVSGDGRADLAWVENGILFVASGNGTDALGAPRGVLQGVGEILAAGDADGDGRAEIACRGAWVRFEGEGVSLSAKIVADARLDGPAGAAYAMGDIDGDGGADFVIFTRRDHCDAIVALSRLPGWTGGDWDADGLSDDEEAELSTDPRARDTDKDGLLDGWEVHGFRGVRLDRMGANPRKKDIFLELDVEQGADMARVERAIERMKKLYAAAPLENPDGTTGIAMHCFVDTRVPIWAENGPGRRELRELFFTPERVGLFHWMHLAAQGGGGQADMWSDQGSCAGVFEATLPHEFGHELGLNHGGRDGTNGIPHYPSLMNYAYNYQLGGTLEATDYSRGDLAHLALDENALPERIEVPCDRLRYLAGPPFYFRIEPRPNGGARESGANAAPHSAGGATWVDWNRNGREDPAPVRANINAAAGEGYGPRVFIDDVAKAPGGEETRTEHAPVLVSTGERLVLLYLPKGEAGLKIRVLDGGDPAKFGPPTKVVSDLCLTELAAAAEGKAIVAFAREGGAGPVVEMRGAPGERTWTSRPLPGTEGRAPAAAASEDSVFLVLCARDGTLAGRRRAVGSDAWSAPFEVKVVSAVPPGLAWDAVKKEVLLATTDPGTNRIRLTRLDPADFAVRSTELVGGPKAGDATTQRPAIVFSTAPWLEPEGEVSIFVSGATDWSKPGAWAHMFRCYTIGDKEWMGRSGWKCDMTWNEWSYTTAGPGAAFHAGRLWQATRFYTFWPGGTQWNDRVAIGPNADGICEKDLRDCNDWEIVEEGLVRSILQEPVPKGKR